MIIQLIEVMHMDCHHPRWVTIEAYQDHDLAEARRRELVSAPDVGPSGHGHKYRIRGIYVQNELPSTRERFLKESGKQD